MKKIVYLLVFILFIASCGGKSLEKLLEEQAGQEDIAKIKELVDTGDINAVDNSDTTALMYAAENGYADIVKSLIQKGANISVYDDNYLPIVQAVMLGDAKLVKKLIKEGADIEASYTSTYYRSSSILRLASALGNLDIVKILVEAGAEGFSSAFYEEQPTPLMKALSLGNKEVVKFLIKEKHHIDTSNKYDDAPILMTSDIELIKLLIEAEANLEATEMGVGYTALLYAAQRGDMEVVKLLLEAGAYINPYGTAATSIASENGYDEIAELLEATQVKINNDWIDSVKGKTLGNCVFNEAGNFSGTMGLGYDFVFSPYKNRAVYKASAETAFLLALASMFTDGDSANVQYIGLSIDGDNLYMHSYASTPANIDWDVISDEDVLL